MFSGEKTDALVQAIVLMFTNVLDAFETALTSSAGDKTALKEATAKIDELTGKLDDVDSDVALSLETALTPLLDRIKTLTSTASDSTPPTA
jgi:hypothetical protein